MERLDPIYLTLGIKDKIAELLGTQVIVEEVDLDLPQASMQYFPGKEE